MRESNFEMYCHVFFLNFNEKEKCNCYGIKVIIDTTINNYIESLMCIIHKKIVNGSYNLLKE